MTAVVLVVGLARAVVPGAAHEPVRPHAPAQEPAPASAPADATPPPSEEAPPAGLDFDLLGTPAAAVAPVDEGLLVTRRVMLTLHQGAGFALVALMADTMVTGQLNYSDRFDGPATGQFETAHQVLAFSSAATFAVTGALAFLAPVPIEKEHDGLDRVTLHWIGMLGAAAGMAAEIVLGLVSVSLEGKVGQADMARAHLVVGYSTLACMTGSLAALIF